MENTYDRTTNLAGEWFIYTGTKECSHDILCEIKERSDKIIIPGVMQEQGYGEKVSINTEWVQSLYDRLWYEREEYKFAQDKGINVPFICQPPLIYRGKAWYLKSFEVEKEQDGCWFSLFIECTKWKTTVWVDHTLMGEYTGLCTPHEYDLGILSEGTHTILLCVDNSWQYPYRPDGHGVTDALGGGWNGLAGRVELHIKNEIKISEVRVFTNINKKTAEYEITIERCYESRIPEKKDVVTTIEENPKEEKYLVYIEESGECKEFILAPGSSCTVTLSECMDKDTTLWDEFHQTLLTRKISIAKEYSKLDTYLLEYGVREICVKGDQFFVNGRPTYFRGTHFGGDYPLTGYPDCTSEFWDKVMNTVKEWGLNFIRFHSYCPPEAAFASADRVGVYLQVECGMWNVFSKNSEMNKLLDIETERILHRFGNHPSFILMSPSNEPGGEWYEPLKQWVIRWRKRDPRRLYTAQSGWPYPVPPEQITGTDYAYFHRSGFGIQPGGTIRNVAGWNGRDYRESLNGIKMPVICHELGQWCSYPDYSIIDKFTGYLQPGNYKVFKESAKKHGVLDKNKDFVYNSGKLQVSMYKEEIEANFRTPHLYGFELLDLHDYIGQGTALVGVLDTFWDNKGYVKTDEWRMFCSETVPLVRLKKHVYTMGETVKCEAEICHFGEYSLDKATVVWKLMHAGDKEVLAESNVTLDIPIGKNVMVTDINFLIPEETNAVELKLELSIWHRDKQIAVNQWKLWAYQKEIDTWFGENKKIEGKHAVYLTMDWKEATKRLKDGERVLFVPPADTLSLRCAPVGFHPVFWNAQMGPTWKRNLGLLIKKDHAAFKGFPTESYSDWQWEELLKECRGFELEGIDQKVDTLVQVIDEWNRNLRMDLVFEARLGSGSLFLSMVKPMDTQVCQALYNSFLSYMQSDAFSPEREISIADLKSRFWDNHCMERLGAACKMVERANELDHKNKTNDVHGNMCAMDKSSRYPYTIEITMSDKHRIDGIIYFPKQNNRERIGEIKAYQVNDKDGSLLSEGVFPSSFEPKGILFQTEVFTDKLYFTALSGHEGQILPNWRMEKDGWYCKKEKYIESDETMPSLFLSSPELSFECAGYDSKRTSYEQITNSNNNSWNRHVAKSDTKEIDV